MKGPGLNSTIKELIAKAFINKALNSKITQSDSRDSKTDGGLNQGSLQSKQAPAY